MTVKTWGQRFKFIAGAAAALTAVIGVATAAFQSYQSLQEARQARLDTKTSYELLVSKVNSMAERLAYVEGSCSARAATATEPARLATPAPTLLAPLPAPTAVAVATDGDSIPDKTAKAPPAKFKVRAYQQLPSSLDTLMQSKGAYAE